MLGDASNSTVNNRVCKEILEAEPMAISANLAKSSGVQARSQHAGVCFDVAPAVVERQTLDSWVNNDRPRDLP